MSQCSVFVASNGGRSERSTPLRQISVVYALHLQSNVSCKTSCIAFNESYLCYSFPITLTTSRLTVLVLNKNDPQMTLLLLNLKNDPELDEDATSTHSNFNIIISFMTTPLVRGCSYLGNIFSRLFLAAILF